MFITRIMIENFRGIERVLLEELPRRVLFLGENHQGKTSILNAVQQVLYGQCFDCNETRLQNPELARTPGRVTIELDVEHGQETVRLNWVYDKTVCMRGVCGFKKERQLSRWVGTPKEVRQQFWEWADQKPDQAECMGNPQRYVTSPDLGKLITELVDQSVDQDALTVFCGKHQDWFEQACNIRGITINTPEDLYEFGKGMAEDRTIANRSLKEITITIKKGDVALTKEILLPNGDTVDIATIDKHQVILRLECLGKEKDALLIEQGKTEPCDAETIQGLATRVEANLEQYALTKEKFAEAKTRVEGHNEACQQLNESLTRTLQELDMATSLMLDLRGDNCPVCKRKWGQQLTKTLVTPARQRNMDAKEAHDAASEAWRTAKAKLDKAKQNYNDWYEGHQKHLREKEYSCSEFLQLVGTSYADWKENPACVEASSGTDIIDQISSIEKRIENGIEIRDLVTSHEHFLEVEKEAEALQEACDELTWAVKAFRDGEYQKAHSETPTFITDANEILTKFGLSMAIETDGKKVELMVTNPNGKQIPLRQASKGERVVAQLAVAVAFGNGSGMVCLDDVDGLCFKDKGVLIRTVSQIESQSIWMCGVWGLGDEPNLQNLTSIFDPIGIVWVANGKAENV